MRTVARTLVRVLNHQLGLDDHVFLYGNENPEEMEAWEEGFAHLSEKHNIPDGINWLSLAWEQRHSHTGKLFASYHQDGWLIMLRHDRVDPRRVAAAVNDNTADDIAPERGRKTN